MALSNSPGVPEICAQCQAFLPPDARECPDCGYIPNGVSAIGDRSQTAYALLSAANLARMRGHWEDAIQKCVEALRFDPQNSTAHSLVGDIYQDQGRREEAIQWYQMALELDPVNAADRAKLDRLLNPEVTTTVQVRPPLWQRVGIPVALILAFLMMSVGIWALLSTQQELSPMANSGGSPPPINLPPNLSPKTRRPAGGRTAVTSQPPASPPPAPASETSRESKLRGGLAYNLPSSQGTVQAMNVQIDPGPEAATLTLLYRPRESLDASQVIQSAAEAAAQAYRLDTYLQSCKIRVLTPRMGGVAPEVALIALSSRNQALAAMTPESVFSSLWWNPEVIPHPPVMKTPSSSTPPTPPPVRGNAPDVSSPAPSVDSAAPVPSGVLPTDTSSNAASAP